MKRIRHKRRTFILISLAILLLAGVVYIKFIKPKQSDAKKYPQVTINPSQNTDVPKTATANPNVPGGTTGSDVNNDAKLIAPSGNFVSSHTLPMSAQAESTCTTTVDATCQIVFTKDGVTKSLPAKKTTLNKGDQNGSVTWPVWTPESIGLSQGVWTISAVATLNSQTQTTVDSVKLTIKP